jgi:excinuclease ABC subunit C
LLQHFPNLEALKAAAVEELAAVPGLNRQVAEKVQDWLREHG